MNGYQSVKGLSHTVSDALYPMAIVLPVGTYLGGTLADNRYAAETGLVLAAVEATTFLSVVAMKQLIGRDRPYVAYPDCITGGEDDPLKSFPSGHAAATTAMSTYLSLRYPYWYVIAPAALYTGYTYFARMNLGMHYPTDILVGALIGGGIAYLGYHLTSSIGSGLNSILPTAMIVKGSRDLPIVSLSIKL